MFRNTNQSQSESQDPSRHARNEHIAKDIQDFAKKEIKNGLSLLGGTTFLGFVAISILQILFDRAGVTATFTLTNFLLSIIIFLLVVITLVLMRIAYILVAILFDR